ncbi:hypothetical protein [uncultured Polaribacter sp.]|uniref:hypothetical protein n=1 Tax=uncultured Polaribacter sp. TaxID=174711 RepID=UPI0026077526|nr:hypothetical protein [uncultured Polaribacter sp.]
MKTVGIHALTHDEEDEDDHAIECIICDTAITHNSTPILPSDIQEELIEYIEIVTNNLVTKNYSFHFSNSVSTNQLHSRPPPMVI